MFGIFGKSCTCSVFLRKSDYHLFSFTFCFALRVNSHKLDANSPLVKSHIRERLKRTSSWSDKSHQGILNSLVDFPRIRITFNGTAAASNSPVFAMKVYTIEDIYVGWTFADMFYLKKKWWNRRSNSNEGNEDQDEKLILDNHLIHDILPQPGGGQEPIEG